MKQFLLILLLSTSIACAIAVDVSQSTGQCETDLECETMYGAE